jgi:arylsulfatase A-like enzyme
LRRLRDEGTLTPEQRACFTKPRPAEELYDVDADPHELHNLAGGPAHAAVLARMREALGRWERETGDRAPAKLNPDEFDRESGEPLPNRNRPRPSKPGSTPGTSSKH